MASCAAQRQAVARIEVRAFGCLLEELLARCKEGPLLPLHSLRDACLAEAPASRPSFETIIAALEGIQR